LDKYETFTNSIAHRIKEELGSLLLACDKILPQLKMADVQPTPVETLERAIDIGKRAGLKFVYAGNIPGHNSENTVCYACGKMVVKRYGYQTRITGLDGWKCGYCGANLNFRVNREVAL
jgi:pyruvate formate lyase activating enzyme